MSEPGRGRRALVTGASGFLGRHLCRQLLDEGWEVRSLTRRADEALAALGLDGEFDGVFGADAMGDVCKPERAAFEKITTAAGIDPKTTAFFEDSVKNLAAAAEMGMTTVLIRSHTAAEEGARTDGFAPNHTIEAVTEAEVRRILPGLWDRA